MRARPTKLLACLCLVASWLAGCASSCDPCPTPLNPLFSAESGAGSYEVDPETLRPPRPPPSGPSAARVEDPAAPDQPACKHDYQSYATHPYVDPLTGLPALCAIWRCTKCGEIRHECQKGPRR